MRPRWVVAVAVAVAMLAAAATPNSGKELFAKRCGGCHSPDRDKEGPRLAGVYGRRAASVKSFEYSQALSKSGVVWTADNLDKWLAGSEDMVPGTEMTYRVDSAEERREIIEYLKKISPAQ